MVGYSLSNNSNVLINNNKKLINRNFSYGLNFNGLQKIQAVSSPSLNVQTNFSIYFIINTFTITPNPFPIASIIARLRPSTFVRDWYVFLVNSGGSSDYSIYFQSTNNSGSSFLSVATSTVLKTNRIYHCFCLVDSFKNITIRAYEQEQLITEANGSIPIYTYDNIDRQVYVGDNTENYFFNGVMYDLKIFNEFLSESNIQQLLKYNNYNNNMLLHLPFNQISGATTAELVSGNPANLIGYNVGDKPIRDINNSIVQQYII